ncbi:2-oxo-4-hydroxy-4-carboxy-5-ureidoimidazoline decarboxylase [Halococcus thailandensis]|uniref:2-oxo-4-hydroxy-4-carboxy-5-ureidoimidazoline decarboxylase n=1 Tax=Halococcus thailandensis JCM 13552 TaxID=1227457 RepID=M0N0V4_9EURY|nr:2-oxo-4-hydroxy-4-carboxy-5-ureidoimidazoline decarboxylase [Halococcus thailandensis]EMA51597.1 Uricase [Halococcus thailandensis JCM 13552]
MAELTLEEANQLDEDAFVDRFGSVYETSPWVAERSRSAQPFSSVSDLQETFEATVEEASEERTRELLKAHPDLGNQTEMTDASEQEQASAGLDQLTPEQYEAFQRLNDRYQEKFGFPFIMSVNDESPETIRSAMEERVEHSPDEEFRTALDEVHEIARLRLDDMVEG